MTPPDSCPGKSPSFSYFILPEEIFLLTDENCGVVKDSFSPTSGPLFPHLSRLQHPFDRMADYQRVPAL